MQYIQFLTILPKISILYKIDLVLLVCYLVLIQIVDLFLGNIFSNHLDF